MLRACYGKNEWSHVITAFFTKQEQKPGPGNFFWRLLGARAWEICGTGAGRRFSAGRACSVSWRGTGGSSGKKASSSFKARCAESWTRCSRRAEGSGRTRFLLAGLGAVSVREGTTRPRRALAPGRCQQKKAEPCSPARAFCKVRTFIPGPGLRGRLEPLPASG